MALYQLTDEGCNQLFKQPVETKGDGGFQSLLVKLQGQVKDNKIDLSVEDKKRICQYASYRGGGGWEETYLEKIFGNCDFFKNR